MARRLIPGIAFDANGVLHSLIRAIPGAKEAIDNAVEHNIPVCILTNAAGRTDAARAAYLNNKIGVSCFNKDNVI